MTEVEFFNELILKTKSAFNKSNVKILQNSKKQKWNYSVCATPIRKRQILLFGLNWGGNNHEAQATYPIDESIYTYKFIKQSFSYLSKFLKIENLNLINYSNIVFFRTPKISNLVEDDWDLSIPLFIEYLQYINPPYALSLGVSSLKYLKKNKSVWKYFNLNNLEEIKIKGKSKIISSFKGKIYKNIMFYFLPHPQSHLSKNEREKLWRETI